jgi:hypothetical protein
MLGVEAPVCNNWSRRYRCKEVHHSRGVPMEFVIWVETRLAGKTLGISEVARLERSASGIEPEELGLTLQDGKSVLKQIQAKMVTTHTSLLGLGFKLCRIAVGNSA